MAIRRPIMDMIDRGLDPRLPHLSLDKRGYLTHKIEGAAPILAVEDVKENLLTNDKKEVITETEENSVESTKVEPSVESIGQKRNAKKTNKTVKPA